MEKPFTHITFQHANYRIITNGTRVLYSLPSKYPWRLNSQAKNRVGAYMEKPFIHITFQHANYKGACTEMGAYMYSKCMWTLWQLLTAYLR